MNPDDLLYHYTNAEALLGILGKPRCEPEIWLSQIQYMNDHQEWWYAMDLMSDTLVNLHSNHRVELHRLAKTALPAGSTLSRGVRHYSSFIRTFVFSLSEKDDLLSQWRGYAPDGGYSIGFRYGDLAALAQRNGFRLVKCVYEDDEKQLLVEQLLDSLQEDIRNEVQLPKFAERSGVDKVAYSAFHKFRLGFLDFASYFKHRSFREECEWRLIGVIPAGGSDSRERWRTRKDQILPYCALPLLDPSDTNSFPIGRIVTGPGVDVELSRHSIQFLRMGRPGNIQIDFSESTLRR